MQLRNHAFIITLVFSLVFLSPLAYSVEKNELSLQLNIQPRYGTSQLITGKLEVTVGEISSDKRVKAYVNNNKKIDLSFKQFLDASLIPYTASKAVYSTSSGQQSSSSSSKMLGFRINSNIIRATIKLSGNSDNLSIDVGNDDFLDWLYFNPGDFSWSPQIYSPGASSSTNIPSDRAIVDAAYERCQRFNLDFNPLYNSSVIQIITKVEKTDVGSILKARLQDIGSCEMKTSESLNTIQEVGCEITVTDPVSGTYDVCLYTDSSEQDKTYYKLPVTLLSDNEKYYFITLRKAVYSSKVDGSAIFSGSKFVDSLNSYFNNCELDNQGYCLVPFKAYSESQLSVSNLELIDDEGIAISGIYDLNYQAPIISLYDTVSINLDKFNLTAPSSIRSSNELRFTVDDEQESLMFSTVAAPTARISASKQSAALLEQISFDASRSLPVQGSSITGYSWDFGDGTVIQTVQPYSTHAFATAGTQTIKLTVIDTSGIEASTIVSITILPGSQSIDKLIDLTRDIINSTRYYLDHANQNVKDTASTLGYYEYLDEASSTLTSLELKAANIQTSELTQEQMESEFSIIINEINKMHDTLPAVMQVTNSLASTQYLDYSQIPSTRTFEPGIQKDDAARIAIYQELSKNNIQMDAKAVRIRYVSGKIEDLVLIKKTLSLKSQPSYILEYSPAGFSSLITQGNNLNENMIKYPANTKEIIYMIKGSLLDAKGTKTLTIPDLSNLPEPPKAECGDDVCSYSEELGIDESNPDNQYYCRLDCEREVKLGTLLFIFVIVGLGIYWINFYRGPWNFKDTTNAVTVLLFKRRLFTSKKDLLNLTNFVRASLQKGFTKQQLTVVLIKKGWTDDQLRSVFNNLKK